MLFGKRLHSYIKENGYNRYGQPRELYLNSPGQVSDNELLTEIQIPIYIRGETQ